LSLAAEEFARPTMEAETQERPRVDWEADEDGAEALQEILTQHPTLAAAVFEEAPKRERTGPVPAAVAALARSGARDRSPKNRQGHPRWCDEYESIETEDFEGYGRGLGDAGEFFSGEAVGSAAAASEEEYADIVEIPFVPVKIGKNEAQLMVDSGSTLDLIGKEGVNQLPETVTVEVVKRRSECPLLKTASGQLVRPNERVRVKVFIAGKPVTLTFWVMDGLPAPFLLGARTMNVKRADVLWSNRTFSVQADDGERVITQFVGKEQARAFAVEQVVAAKSKLVKPGEHYYCEATLASAEFADLVQPGLLTASPTGGSFCIARRSVNVAKQGRVCVALVNVGSRPAFVKAGSTVACFQPRTPSEAATIDLNGSAPTEGEKKSRESGLRSAMESLQPRGLAAATKGMNAKRAELRRSELRVLAERLETLTNRKNAARMGTAERPVELRARGKREEQHPPPARGADARRGKRKEQRPPPARSADAKRGRREEQQPPPARGASARLGKHKEQQPPPARSADARGGSSRSRLINNRETPGRSVDPVPKAPQPPSRRTRCNDGGEDLTFGGDGQGSDASMSSRKANGKRKTRWGPRVPRISSQRSVGDERQRTGPMSVLASEGETGGLGVKRQRTGTVSLLAFHNPKFVSSYSIKDAAKTIVSHD
jgi:hypothetical protein